VRACFSNRSDLVGLADVWIGFGWSGFGWIGSVCVDALDWIGSIGVERELCVVVISVTQTTHSGGSAVPLGLGWRGTPCVLGTLMFKGV
jgi:hypothetical protein